MTKPADTQEASRMLWHITRDMSLVCGEGYWQLEGAIQDCRGTQLGWIEISLTNQQAESILTQVSRAYAQAKRKSFFDRAGWGFPPGEYELRVESVEAKPMPRSPIPQHRMIVRSSIISGPNSSEEFQGETLLQSYYLGERGLSFVLALFRACDVEWEGQGPSPLQDIDGFLGKAEGMIGKCYDATVKRTGDHNQYVTVCNERPPGAAISEPNQ